MTLADARRYAQNGLDGPGLTTPAVLASDFAACDGLVRIGASRPPLHHPALQARLHEPCVSAIALPVGRASRHQRASRPRSPRAGRTARGPLLRQEPQAGRVSYRLPRTNSPSPYGQACLERVRRVGHDRRHPSDQDATFQYVLLTVSKRNSSVKQAPHLTTTARLLSCRRGLGAHGQSHWAKQACTSGSERLRFPEPMSCADLTGTDRRHRQPRERPQCKS